MKTHSTVIAAAMMLAACSSSDNSEVANSCGLNQSKIGSFVSVPSGSFIKSEDPVYPEEGTPRNMQVTGFEIQIHEVTNGQFSKFVEETGYKTDAEKALGSKDPAAGSALFKNGDSENQTQGSWLLVNGATWRNPDGNDTKLEDLENYPVVHVSQGDAAAYAKWAGGRLPTEVEWEYASSLGLANTEGLYRGAFSDDGTPIANTWQGLFPVIDKGNDGFKGAAPVGCFPANSIGAVDMIGNVWEWTSTPYNMTSHTIKGGSFLCAPNYCRRYRSSARQPHERNFSTNHIGFRIIKDAKKSG